MIDTNTTAISAISAITTRLLLLTASLRHAALDLGDRLVSAIASEHRERIAGDRGQATTEYALVLLAAALVALLVVAWATAGGGAARISGLFDRVIDSVIDRV